MSDGLWYMGDLKPGPGEVRVNVECKSCRRYWFSVIGAEDGTARRVVGYSERTVGAHPGGSVGFDRSAYERGLHKGNLAGLDGPVAQVRVTTGHGPKVGEREIVPGGVRVPMYAYQRLSIECHRKCGRRLKVLESTLVNLFAEVVRIKRHTTAL